MNKDVKAMRTGIYNHIIMQSVKAGLLLLLSTSSLLALGQAQQNLGRDHNEQVTIIGSYDPSINEAFKINTRPGESAITFDKPTYTFTAQDFKQETAITLEEIKPVSIRAGQRPQVYENYLLAGFGSLLSPMVDFTHSSGEKNDYHLNFHAYSLSSFLNIPDYAPSNFSNSLAELNYDKYFGEHLFTTTAYYGFNTTKYYGFKPEDFPQINEDEIDQNQVFNLLKINAGLASNYLKSSKLHHDFNLSAYYYFDKYKTSESDVSFDFDLHKSFDVNKNLNYQFLGLKADIEYVGLKDSISTNNNFLFYGIPYFKAKYGDFSFNIGVNFSYLNAAGFGFKIYPVLDITYTLVPERFTVYGGLGGGLSNNSYLKLSKDNPWVSSVIPTMWKDEKLKVYGGIRGNFATKVNFNVEVDWSLFENDYFFYNISEYPGILGIDYPENKFSAAYDKGSVFQISGEVAYVFTPEFKTWIGGYYHAYILDSLDKPYQKPLSMLQFGASYIIKQKVTLNAEIYTMGKRYAIDANRNTVDMAGFFDLNLGAEYKINEEFSVFLNATNLLNSHYERFYNYPVQGLQIMGGIGWRF